MTVADHSQEPPDQGPVARLLGEASPDLSVADTARITTVLEALAAPPAPGELAQERETVASLAAAVRRDALGAPTAVPERTPGSLRRSAPFRTRVAAVAGAAALVIGGGTVAAAQGVLPAPIQAAAHTVLGWVSVKVPSPGAEPTAPPAVQPPPSSPSAPGSGTTAAPPPSDARQEPSPATTSPVGGTVDRPGSTGQPGVAGTVPAAPVPVAPVTPTAPAPPVPAPPAVTLPSVPQPPTVTPPPLQPSITVP